MTERSQGFAFLEAELRDLPKRQRSMRAVLAQSWQRLTEAERTVFMRLTVFRGGFTRVAAQQVAGASVRMLSSFVNKSLVQCEPNRRYTIHEFLRQYAEAELEAADQTADAIRRTHALYYLTMAEQAEPGLIHTEWLEANHNNLRAALNWALDQRDAEIALRLGLALGPFWWTHGYQREGFQWLEAILTISTIRPKSRDQAERWTSLRADALNAAALMAWARSDYVQATALHAESLALAQELEKEALIIRSLSGLGMVAVYEGDYARATALLTEGLALARALDEKRLRILPLINLGMMAWHQGDYARAAVLLIENLAVAQEAEDQTLTAWSLRSLGMVAFETW